MNLEIRRVKRSAPGPDPEEGGPDRVQDTGEPGANQGDDQPREAGGAPKAHAGDGATPENETDDLGADPEIERKTTRGEEDPKRHLKATAPPGGHAA